MIRFETEVSSSAGGRRQNQDCVDYLMMEGFACWVLADGLGGHGGGATAAKIAVESIRESFFRAPSCTPEGLLEYFARANEAIRTRQKQEPPLSEMRTTAVVLVSDFRISLWGHVGDSRLYYFKRGKVHFQTRDHSVPQALCNAGEITAAEIRFHEDRNRLLRCLGSEEVSLPAIEKVAHSLDRQDAFLLCSDGFWEYVTESDMEEDLGAAAEAKEWLNKMESKLKKRATGEHDNYSAIGILAHAASVEPVRI